MTEYLNYLKRGELIAERARVKTELNLLKVKKEDDVASEELQTVKTELENVLKAADARLKAQMEENRLDNGGGVGAQEQSLANLTLSGDAMMESMAKTAKIQQIMDTVRTTDKMKIGDPVETFICRLNQLYLIEVKPQLEKMPQLELEFVNAAKGLLTYPMFSQLQKSGKVINSWDDFEKYLIVAHGSRISNFQYLHKLWGCQLQSDERFSDFGARLEEQIHHASMHIQASFKKNHSENDMTASDVFALLGSMLAGLQVKEHHPDAYKSLIKTCDKHWSASSLLNEAADYSDKMPSGETCATNTNMAFHAKLVKTEKKQKPKAEKKKSTSKKSSDRLEEYKKKCANQICEAFLKGTCKYGERCFRMHPVQNSVHYTEIAKPEVDLKPEVDAEQFGIENLFH